MKFQFFSPYLFPSVNQGPQVSTQHQKVEISLPFLLLWDLNPCIRAISTALLSSLMMTMNSSWFIPESMDILQVEGSMESAWDLFR